MRTQSYSLMYVMDSWEEFTCLARPHCAAIQQMYGLCVFLSAG